jgi:sortase (surface protein transpeptidase)
MERTALSVRRKPPFGVFLAAFTVVFVTSLSAAESVGFVPCSVDGTCSASPRVTLSDLPQLGNNVRASETPATVVAPIVVPTHPTRMKIQAIDLDHAIQNPTTTNLKELDELTKKGPARHPLSGKLGEDRNMILFGHSSRLPVVHNQMYKAFNRLSELTPGDTIEIIGENGKTYLYSVTVVRKADTKAFSENFVAHPLKKLYLITCNNADGKSARYIVEADFVGTLQ